jgi:hypothetical protein
MIISDFSDSSRVVVGLHPPWEVADGLPVAPKSAICNGCNKPYRNNVTATKISYGTNGDQRVWPCFISTAQDCNHICSFSVTCSIVKRKPRIALKPSKGR